MRNGVRCVLMILGCVWLCFASNALGDDRDKPMNKSEIYATLADRTGMTKAQVQSVLDALAQLSYEEAKNGFVLPGIGKLVLVDRPARMARNPATGEEVHVPAKKVVKFRVAKACQDAVLAK